MYCLHLEGQRATSIRGVIVTCNMLQDAVYRVDRQKPDCMRSGAGVCYFASYFSILPHRYPETAYLYDFSVQNSKSDFFFGSGQKMLSASQHTRTHAHVLLHIQSYIHSFISLYIALANPTLTFFGQEDQTAYYISATTSAIE
jgi:hypothetical protein